LCWLTVEQQFIPALAKASAVSANFKKKMRKTSTFLLLALLLLISCKHVETPLETHDRNAKSSIESITSKVDSLTRTKGVQKTLFLIDTNDIKFKRLVHLDSNITSLILKGFMIKEDETSNNFYTPNSDFYCFDTLTNIFKDTAYVIIQKEHSMFENIRQYLIWRNKDTFVIKLLAAEDSSPWMSFLTMSALIGDSILYTQEISSAVSDAGVSKGKMWTIDLKKTSKFNFQDFSYVMVDSLRTAGER
jgi:hypothetical protein